MSRSTLVSRAKQRQEKLRELATQESVQFATSSVSRAIEAIRALQRIQDGTYGVCADCGRNIPASRLQIKPEATRCVVCQSEYEQRRSFREGVSYGAKAQSA